MKESLPKTYTIARRLGHLAEGTILIYSVVGALIAVAVTIYQVATLSGTYRTQFAGLIADKRIVFHESREGAWAERYLVIEKEASERFWVHVNESLYNQAEVGMWIEKDNGGIKLQRQDAQIRAAGTE